MIQPQACFQENLLALELKYPQLAFLLKFESLALKGVYDDEELINAKVMVHGKEIELYGKEDAEKELSQFQEKLKVEELEALYQIGLGLALSFPYLLTWVEKNPKRHIDIFEDSPQVILAFLHRSNAKDILLHPQVELHYVMNRKLLQAIEEIIRKRPYEKVLVSILPSYIRAFSSLMKKVKYQVYRASSIAFNLLKEDLYQHRLFRNYLLNYQQLPLSRVADDLRDAFKNVPCIVCGAGPSLNYEIETLKNLQDRALILAGGSTITALSSQRIFPHFGFAIDPNDEEYLRFKPSKALAIPIIYGTRVYPEIFHTFSGTPLYLRTQTGGLLEVFLDEKLGLSGELFQKGVSQDGMSVTMICIASAIAMGCSPIILVGIDLSYLEGKHYADGVVKDPKISSKLLKGKKVCDKLMRRKNREGDYVLSCTRWVMEHKAINELIKNHPELRFIDAIQGGLGFKAADKMSLREFALSHRSVGENLQGKVFAAIQKCKGFKQEEVTRFIEELKDSFIKSKQFLMNLLERIHRYRSLEEYHADPYVIMDHMDLEAEPSFQKTLKTQLDAFDQITAISLNPLQDLHNRWRFLLEITNYYLQEFE